MYRKSKDEGGRMKDENRQQQTTGQVVFILHPSAFILYSPSAILQR
jgi:hypothetical protein